MPATRTRQKKNPATMLFPAALEQLGTTARPRFMCNHYLEHCTTQCVDNFTLVDYFLNQPVQDY